MVRQHSALKDFYETNKTIGSGGFAKVKLAIHLLTGEKVAIKIMNKELLGDDLPRVQMELEALKGLSHQHICKLYQVLETDTHYYLVMEYCSGGELFDYIVQNNRLSEMESRIIFRQILAAVAYLHSKGYVHRDIKPENVLLDKDQNVKLIDFGLCAKPSPVSGCLSTACGSPTYAAPELIQGDKYQGPAVDVWSLGVLLYALLCGSLPFDSENIDTLYKQIQSGKYAKPPHLSEGSRKILGDMLETNPAKRITIDKLLSHPWIQVVYGEPVSYTSIYKDIELDNNCVNTLAAHCNMTGNDMWKHLSENQFDHLSATYQLLLSRKRQGLPLTLLPQRPQGTKHSNSRVGSRARGTYVRLPARKALIVEEDRENREGPMVPPESPQVRVARKRPYPVRDPSASPVPKKVTKQNSSLLSLEVPKEKNNSSAPSTPTVNNSITDSPRARLFNSIERKIQRMRNVLTPKRQGSPTVLPTLLTAKNMSNISTTSSNSPEHVRDELVAALYKRGIECKCKGYSVRGKLVEGGKVCKLSFELEVCLIPTTANAKGSVVGIRRKRLKGDAWCYKRVCEEILRMADL